jgi:hypothetical protein
VQCQPEQTAIDLVVNVARQVGEDRRCGVREVVEDLDDAGLLGDEDPAVGSELHVHRLAETAEHDLLAEAGRQHGRRLGALTMSDQGRQPGTDQGGRHEQTEGATA